MEAVVSSETSATVYANLLQNETKTAFTRAIFPVLGPGKNFAQWGSAVCVYVRVGRSSLKGDFIRFPVLNVKKKRRTRLLIFSCGIRFSRRSQWPCGLKHRSATARLLRLLVRMPPGALTSACCDCCMLSGRGLCDELITRPEESYRLWCVVVCDLETS